MGQQVGGPVELVERDGFRGVCIERLGTATRPVATPPRVICGLLVSVGVALSIAAT